MATTPPQKGELLIPWIYDLALWVFALCLDIFFREVYPRSAWRVPKHGPVLIVAAPHANQFVDSVILMRVLKQEAKRRVSFLIAEKSMKEPYIGTLAACMGALPVARAMDKVKVGNGKIYLPDPIKNPNLIRGIGTDFTKPDFMLGGSIIVPRAGKGEPSAETIAKIIGPEELLLKKPFKSPDTVRQLTEVDSESGQRGTNFKVAPHIDQSQVYETVFDTLSSGGCIGIFPEGGSHDRSDLLPLKAGVAIMALGALARDPNCGLTIIPCGMNYFHAHKFRSRAVIEFGHPIEVHPDQIEAYKAGGSDKRDAIGSLLETIHQGLATVTQLSPDFDTLMLVQATRRLYNPLGKKLPLSLVVELNRRLMKGYTMYQNDPGVIELMRAVLEYNKRLRALGIKDHQVEWGNMKKRPWWLTFTTLLYRIFEIILLSIATLPGLAMFWPVFVTSKVISVKKQKKALAASVVKLRGRDVVGTWKILVAMGLAPALYLYYDIVVTLWLHYNRQDGYYTSYVPWWMVARTYIPDSVPLWFFSICFFVLMIQVTFAALRIGEVGMDVIKSLPPLLVALDPRSSDSLVKLQAHRQALSIHVTETINELGPEVFPGFDAERIIPDPFRDGAYQSRLKAMPPSEPESRIMSVNHSRNASSNAVGGLLSSSSLKMRPLSSTSISKDSLSDVNKRIRDAMQLRGRNRESRSRRLSDGDRSWDMADGSSGEDSEEDEDGSASGSEDAHLVH